MTIKFAAFFFCFLFSNLISSCQVTDGSIWTDGWQFFNAHFITANKLIFEGGTLHEGGSSFACDVIVPTKIKIQGGVPGNEDYPGYGRRGWMLQYKKINGVEVLTARDTGNVFKGFLLRLKPDQSLQQYTIQNKINFQLAGSYSTTGKDSIIFFRDKSRVKWNGHERDYVFETEYDFPADVIKITGNRSYYYERKFQTLFLYQLLGKDEDEYKKGKLLYKLNKKEGKAGNETILPGDFSFASTIPLTEDIIGFYSPEELKLIRNEIFARHGYIFSNKEVKKYFDARPWYKPVSKTIPSDFSELELLNIAQLKKAEKEPAEN